MNADSDTFLTKLKELTCWNRRYLVFNLTMRNLKLRYRNSWLGGLWTVLLPAGSALVYYFIFGLVIRVKTEHYLAFVLSGTLCWTFFSAALNGSMDTIVDNARLLNKVPLPPQALIYGEILTNLLNFLFALPTLLIVILISGIEAHWQLLNFFPLIVLLTLQATGFGLILGVANAYFRDLKHMMAIIFQIWFYMTPILYSLDRWPAEFKWALYLNPVSFLFSELHASVLGSGGMGPGKLAISIVWTGVIFITGLFFMLKTRAKLVEAV